MSLVNLGCPHCNGLLEIDERLAGHQISCPTCHNVVTIPSWADLNPGQAPPPPMDQYSYGAGPPPFAPSPPMDFAPPQSSGFGAPPSMDYAPPPPMSAPDSSALQLSCPHCAGAFSVTPEMQGQEAHCPMCGGVVTIPMFGGYAETPAPAFEPPAYTPQPQFAPQQQYVPQQQFASQPQIAPQPQVAPQQPFPPQSPSSPLYPPGSVSPTSPVGATPAPSSRVSANTPIRLSSAPQTPSTPASVLQRSSSEAPVVLIPTEDGRQVAVSAPVKTVKKGSQEIELRKLSPEEKAIRRRNMNLIMMAFCMIFLSIVFFVLTRK